MVYPVRTDLHLKLSGILSTSLSCTSSCPCLLDVDQTDRLYRMMQRNDLASFTAEKNLEAFRAEFGAAFY